MEDDYCIHKTNLTFDIDLIRLYNEKYPDNIGYLGSLASFINENIYHMAISNGIISKKTFEKIGSDILEKFYKIKNYCPQIAFSILFTNENINLYDLQNEYTFPFWCCSTRRMIIYSKQPCNVEIKYIMIPVQLTE
jgi:hypothetical protein